MNARDHAPGAAAAVTAGTPRHPLPPLTTYELRDYRKQLEHALGDQVIGHAPIAEQLRAALGGVVAEEESRLRLRRANGVSR